MRAVLIPFLTFALMGASDEANVGLPKSDSRSTPEKYQEQVETLKERDITPELVEGPVLEGLNPSNCLDRLERAQEGAGEAVIVTPGPLLRRDPGAPPTPPLAIYAVDRREGRCAVMVIMGNPEDVRPLPKLDAGHHRLMPAGDNQDRGNF